MSLLQGIRHASKFNGVMNRSRWRNTYEIRFEGVFWAAFRAVCHLLAFHLYSFALKIIFFYNYFTAVD